jgi:hypothetical protein
MDNMNTFDVARAWNGKRTILSRTSSYHDTVPVGDVAEREKLCSKQDKWVLEAVRRMGVTSASGINHDLSGTVLLTSVRRSLTTLHRFGLIRKAGTRMGPHGSPETIWTAA